MNSDQVKQALLELLNADTDKGRTWFFPSNVSDRYTIVLGLDLKQSAKAFGATLISVLLMILLFRSKGVLALILYVIVGLISFGGVWAYYTIKPITNRPNISISDFLKQRKQFSKTQKIYFKKPKERI
ncbi:MULTISPECIES: hypothetical protein [Pseudolactococcus]|jgi:hypothetical protein|uniref:Conjugal transfer protein TrsC n=1 Tax=Pseudolactococcus piscium MKFS47 TaxID=297352 RepID=A0A0D6DZY0_9LACT|nr:MULTISPECIES: hypothetical protein [Lactococcus]MBQ2635323.1 hypothetical protein [Methanobrevibacter sp.]MBQ4164056.1 hypothetical protein [Turicibacter sp.]MBQ2652971.1 hypothetical protein [Methanobrevibacter sp.]MCJ1971149.1 glycosyltransferase [Lactococcus carnosus]CEN29518.1 Conjugal transfer protein TrsC [Lactococcus piscium MKFS47]